jgi:uncharacterized membrane protein YcaP (DUF421 family)
MQAAVEFVFGAGRDLNPGQMAARAVSIFIITLLLVRLSGRRSFGQHGAFDACTTVLLGAILSRAVVGASPYWATVAAAAVLVLMHRLVGHASVRWEWFDRLVSGQERTLVAHGSIDGSQMQKALITQRDLREALRKKFGDEDKLSEVERVILERNGDMTVVARSSPRC